MSIPTITTLPIPPQRGVDSQTTFVTKAEAFFDALKNLTVDEMNALAVWMESEGASMDAALAALGISPITPITTVDGEIALFNGTEGRLKSSASGIAILNLLSPTDSKLANLTAQDGMGTNQNFTLPLVGSSLFSEYQNNLQNSDITINFSIDADITLTDGECLNHKFIITDTGTVLTTSRNIIFNINEKSWFIFQNDTAKDLTVKLSTSTGIVVPAGKVYVIKNIGTDIVDSEEYSDNGLLGTPDTAFSSTGARIYPTGTVIGKSSYGVYIRLPNGLLICTRSNAVTIDVTTLLDGRYYGDLGIWIYPHEFFTIPFSNTKFRQNSGRIGIPFEITLSTSSQYQCGVSNSTSEVAKYVSFTQFAIGTWK